MRTLRAFPDNIDQFRSSLPGLTRQSVLFARRMDARVKPAHDGGETEFNLIGKRSTNETTDTNRRWTRHSSPSRAKPATACGSIGTCRSRWTTALVLRADLFRPIDDGKHPVILSYGALRQGPGVPGRQQDRVGPDGRGVSRGRRRARPQVPGLGGGRSGEMGAGRLRVPARRCARRRPLARISRSVVAARDAGHLPMHRMGGARSRGAAARSG